MNTQVIKRWQDIPQICEDDINYLSGDRGELPSVMILKDMNVFDDDEIDMLTEKQCECELLSLYNGCTYFQSQLSELCEYYENQMHYESDLDVLMKNSARFA